MPIDYSAHPSFVHPSKDAGLWRYLDLSKYLAILTRRSLWFSRADQLGDSFEGSTTAPVIGTVFRSVA